MKRSLQSKEPNYQEGSSKPSNTCFDATDWYKRSYGLKNEIETIRKIRKVVHIDVFSAVSRIKLTLQNCINKVLVMTNRFIFKFYLKKKH